MFTSSRALLFASLALPSAFAVSLADFTPRATNLPSSCEAVYTANIPGCQASDFGSGGCSTDCINALNSIVPSVQQACSSVSGGNIIAAVLAGKATQILCHLPDSSSMTTSVASSSQAPSSSSASQASTSDTPSTSVSSISSSSSSSSSSSTPSTTVIVATNTVIPQASLTGTGIVVDTSTPPAVASATQSHNPATQSSINQGGSLLSAQPAANSVGSPVKASFILISNHDHILTGIVRQGGSCQSFKTCSSRPS
ncbi:hypothetical protein ANO11243_086340 [Dothideomycetidae sp. 11243]|nr:hypothetical protein ANO11243_086340 [fungal sp. No.11243]